MKKSYILKFDEVQGDYVIVEKSAAIEKSENTRKNNIFVRKNSLFSNFFFKNRKNQIKSTQNEALEEGYFAELDKKIEEDKKQKLAFAEGLGKINQVEIPSKEVMESDSKVLPKQEEMQENQTSEPQKPEVAPNENQEQVQENTDQSNGFPLQPDIISQPNTSPVQPPSAPSQPRNGDSINEAIELLAGLYGNFRILNMIYQNLRGINNANFAMFSEMISNNIGLQGALLNIYYDVSGRSLPPALQDSVPALPANFQQILNIALARVQGMRDINLRLTKLFNVESFNRVFNLIESTLAVQNGQLLALQNNN